MPPPAPLATPAQLGALLQQTISSTDPSALQLLAQASGVIRRYLDLTVTQVLGDVELGTPEDGVVFLRESPVTNVSLVEVQDPWTGVWSTVPSTAYKASLRLGTVSQGLVNTAGVRWPTDEESWRITYDHGFETVPDDLMGVCVGVASRFYSVPAGVDAERIGNRQVKYSLTADDLNALERLTLDGYRWGKLA